MTSVGVTGLTLEGTDLRTLGINLTLLDGLDGIAGTIIPFSSPSWRQGVHIASGTRYRYDRREFTLNFTALPQDASGVVTTSPLQHAEANLEILAGLLHSNDGSPLSLVKTLPSTLQKEALVYPQGIVNISNRGSMKSVAINFLMAYPFWRELPQSTNASQTGSFSLDNDGTGPVADMQITFNTAGNLIHTQSGDTITVTGDTNILVDLPSGKVTKAGVRNGSAEFSVPYGMEMWKGTNDFTATANVDIDYHHAYLT